jgi:hypothetical protein
MMNFSLFQIFGLWSFLVKELSKIYNNVFEWLLSRKIKEVSSPISYPDKVGFGVWPGRSDMSNQLRKRFISNQYNSAKVTLGLA